jgi:hypothetical protein
VIEDVEEAAPEDDLLLDGVEEDEVEDVVVAHQFRTLSGSTSTVSLGSARVRSEKVGETHVPASSRRLVW